MAVNPRASPVSTLLAGFVGAVGLSAVGVSMRVLLGAPLPFEALFNSLTQFLGTPAMFQFVHATFGYGQGGKIAAFVAVMLAWLGGLTLLRLLGPTFGTAITFLVTALLIPMPYPIVYALLFLASHFALQPVTHDPRRRNALRWLSSGSALLLLGGSVPLLRTLSGSSTAPKSAWTPVDGLPIGVTAQKNLYYVSKNIEVLDPQLNPETWRLEIGGLVKSPRSFSLSELQALPAVTSERTLHCISNPVGGDLIGNIRWTGVSFKALLEGVGVQPGARWVTWRAADGYVESLPLRDVFEGDVLLVYAANGAALERKHGFPLRVLIPDRLGMKQPKWLTRIELSASEVIGYWAERDWTRTGYLETFSRIDEPRGAIAAGVPQTIRGVAFSGTKAITRVEVSLDGQRTWLEARVEPRRSPHAWTLWSLPWTPIVGPQRLTVRAYAAGVMQTATQRESLPEAATGWHSLDVVTA